MLKTLRKHSLNASAVAVTAVVLAFISLAVVLFAQSRAEFARAQAINTVQERIGQASEAINSKLVKAEQLARTLAALFQNVRADRDYVERTLSQVLSAFPAGDIFGAGVWYEPNVFEADTTHYGPYANRLDPLKAPFALTFYWSEPNEANDNYNYHEQLWYTTITAGGGEVRFTEPYLDSGLVFLTSGRAMYEGERLIGVVSVDLVFPQLQDFVNALNTDPSQLIYVTTAGGAVLVYPNAEELLAYAGVTDGLLLDVKAEQAQAFARLRFQEPCYERSQTLPLTGWQVRVCADTPVLFAEANAILSGTQSGIVLLWVVGLVGSAVVGQLFARTIEERRQRLKLQEEVTRQRAVQEVLEAKVQERTIELERAKEEAERANRVKSVFLANMSHELRTPLNAILNYTDFLAMGMLGEVTSEQNDTLQKVGESGRHLLSLINDVLDISKIESGGLKLFVEENIDIMREVQPAIDTTLALLRDKPDVAFVSQVAPDLPKIVGDKRRIRQTLLNLLSNAVKFTEQGRVTLRIVQDGDQIRFSVSDTGVGIPAEELGKVFEPFQQTEAGVRRADGTGLGLPISRRFVEAHGGKMWLESVVGQGTTFHFTLPVQSEALLALMRGTS
jgi:signal transduction histidine kinase